MTTYKLRELSTEIIREHFSKLNEPEWLIELRLTAWVKYKETTQTSVEENASVPLLPADAEEAIGNSCVSKLFASHSQWQPAATFIQAPMHWFTPVQKNQNFLLTTMRLALKSHETLLKKHLSVRINQVTSPMELLTLALWNNGVFIHIPRGVQLDNPIVILKGLASSPNSTMMFDNNLIVAEEDSQAQIFEEGVTVREAPNPESSGYRVGLTNLVVNGGQIDYISLSSYSDSLVDLSNLYTHIGKNGQAKVYALTIGGKLVQRRIFTYLEGSHSSAKHYDLYFGENNEQYDISSGIIHIAPHTTGKMLAKGVLRDTARSMYNGLIRIEPEGQGASNRLSSNTLLLDKQANARAIPSLEIMADDVQASHGATLSHVDDNQLFYLMSRGISRNDAQQLIVSGFFAPLLDTIENKAILKHINTLLQRRLV